jgi:hypothetical protein
MSRNQPLALDARTVRDGSGGVSMADLYDKRPEAQVIVAQDQARRVKIAQDPLTEKGSKIMSAMKEQYGPEQGERAFYASRNKGSICGVDIGTVPGEGEERFPLPDQEPDIDPTAVRDGCGGVSFSDLAEATNERLTTMEQRIRLLHAIPSNVPGRKGWTYYELYPYNPKMAMDAKSLDDEVKDPQGTNRGWRSMGLDPRAPSANKDEEWATGGRKNQYASEPTQDQEDDGDLPEQLIRRLLDHAGELGIGETLLKNSHGRLTASVQASDADHPDTFVGQPLGGGNMTGSEKVERTKTNGAMDAARMAMDVKQRMRRMSRAERDQFVRKNPKLVASLRAYDSACMQGFNQRWGSLTGRIKVL